MDANANNTATENNSVTRVTSKTELVSEFVTSCYTDKRKVGERSRLG